MGDFQQLPTVSGVPRFLSSILAFVVNAAAVLLSVVVVVCFSYAVQGGLICREPSPVACGIHKPCRLLTGIKKAPCFLKQRAEHIRLRSSLPEREPYSVVSRFIQLDHRVLVFRMKCQLPGQKFFDIESVLLVRIESQMVVRMLGKVIFLGKKRSYTTQLQDAFTAIQNRKLID